MEFTPVSAAFIEALNHAIGSEYVSTDEAILLSYGHDETEDLSYPPHVVVKPNTTQEVSSVVKLCNEHHIPITPIGGKTGLSGGALAVYGGVGLSLERMNRIIEIDEQNQQATVEPGVITQVFQEAVIEKGLYYPPDPSSRGSCFIGGNLAENAGGPKAVKYGVTNQYVLNLEVVLSSGEVIWTGANTLKNSTGYNLTQLMVGSEGTLGIITKAVFKLIPYPKHDLLMLVPFFEPEKACEAVSAVFREGVTPSVLEFMDRDALDWVMEYTETVLPNGEDIGGAAHLLVEVDGNDPDVLMKDCETIAAVMEQHNCGEILFAETTEQKEGLWKLRRQVAEAVKGNSVYKEEDTVVPRYQLPKLLAGVKEIGERYGFKSVCYGHAGDGNLHVNIIKGNLSDEAWNTQVPKGIEEIFKLTVSLGGTLSGEHGIGLVQRPYMSIAFNQVQLQLMRAIKQTFDPTGIMNPGKVLP